MPVNGLAVQSSSGKICSRYSTATVLFLVLSTGASRVGVSRSERAFSDMYVDYQNRREFKQEHVVAEFMSPAVLSKNSRMIEVYLMKPLGLLPLIARSLDFLEHLLSI